MKLMKNLLWFSLALAIGMAIYLSGKYISKNCVYASNISLVNIGESLLLIDNRADNPVFMAPHIIKIVTKLLHPGDNVVQVGAGIGYDSVVMGKAISPKGNLFIFQPNDEAIMLLKNNLKINDISNNLYISEQIAFSSDAEVFMQTSEKNFDWYRLFNDPSEATGGVVKQVKAVKIDNTLVRDHAINLMYLNCYGSELQVLMGAQATIQDSPNLSILMTWNPEAMKRYGDINSIINNLLYLKFEFWDVSNADTPKLLTKDKLLKNSFRYLIITKSSIS